jgi:hypothetical protein
VGGVATDVGAGVEAVAVLTLEIAMMSSGLMRQCAGQVLTLGSGIHVAVALRLGNPNVRSTIGQRSLSQGVDRDRMRPPQKHLRTNVPVTGVTADSKQATVAKFE